LEYLLFLKTAKFFEILRRLRGVMKTGARIQMTTTRAAKATPT